MKKFSNQESCTLQGGFERIKMLRQITAENIYYILTSSVKYTDWMDSYF